MSYGSIEKPAAQLFTDNYKLTRAAWFALYAPDAGRHDALLAEDIPPVYRNLFAAILDGSRGLARLALDDGDELSLLDYIAQLPRPRKIPTRRLDIPDNPDLAAALFGPVAALDEGVEIDGIGSGQWPAAPGHTCAAKEAIGTAIIIRPNETHGARMFNPTWRTCPACLHKRVKRMARQTLITIAAAGSMTWGILEKDDYRRFTANIRQHRKRATDAAHKARRRTMMIATGLITTQGDGTALLRREYTPLAIAREATNGATGARQALFTINYTPPPVDVGIHYRALPQDDGRVFVMSTHGLAGAMVPTERRELFDLIHPYAATPDKMRASGSRGYGGKYKKLRGDGRGAGVRLWTDASIETVAGALGAEIKKGRNTFRTSIDAADSYQKLTDAGIALRARQGQGTALETIAGALGGTMTEDVTLKAYSKKENPYTLSVTEESDRLKKAPLPPPPLFDDVGPGGAPCAIYLP